MSAANELRPVQVSLSFRFVHKRAACVTMAHTECNKARVNLEVMMKRQLQLRREETAAVHQYVISRYAHVNNSCPNISHRTCDTLERRLNELKALATPLVCFLNSCSLVCVAHSHT